MNGVFWPMYSRRISKPASRSSAARPSFWTSRFRTPPSIAIAQNAIRDILNDNQPIPVTVERIISEVSRTYGVSPSDVRSNKRSAQISTARQVSAYVIREITQMSMSSIGEEFSGRDHSTMVYAIQQVEKNMAHDSRFKETVEDIVKNIRDN